MVIGILAGGTSSRMGRDKALLEWNNTPLLAHLIDLARQAGGQPWISGPPEKYSGFGVPCLADNYPGVGPLGGIATLLGHLRVDRILLIACDLPFLSARLLGWLWEQSLECEGWTVPESRPGRLEPTCAVYCANLLPTIELALAQGVHAIATALAEAPQRRLAPEQLASAGFGGEMFRNLNRPEDYEEARGRASSAKSQE